MEKTVIDEGVKKKPKVLTICWAGANRSKYMKEELQSRGYEAANKGLLENGNRVTPNDLENVNVVIFASPFEKKKFEDDPALLGALKKSQASVKFLTVTEQDRGKAVYEKRMQELIERIARELTEVGMNEIT